MSRRKMFQDIAIAALPLARIGRGLIGKARLMPIQDVKNIDRTGGRQGGKYFPTSFQAAP